MNDIYVTPLFSFDPSATVNLVVSNYSIIEAKMVFSGTLQIGLTIQTEIQTSCEFSDSLEVWSQFIGTLFIPVGPILIPVKVVNLVGGISSFLNFVVLFLMKHSPN